MVIFFKTSVQNIIAVQADHSFSADETKKLSWLFDNAELLPASTLKGWFIGPRKEMITPWSTNAVEITQNMGLTGISRIRGIFPCNRRFCRIRQNATTVVQRYRR